MCQRQVKLCDPLLLTRAILERLRDEQLIIKRYTNDAYLSLKIFIHHIIMVDKRITIITLLQLSLLSKPAKQVWY